MGELLFGLQLHLVYCAWRFHFYLRAVIGDLLQINPIPRPRTAGPLLAPRTSVNQPVCCGQSLTSTEVDLQSSAFLPIIPSRFPHSDDVSVVKAEGVSAASSSVDSCLFSNVTMNKELPGSRGRRFFISLSWVSITWWGGVSFPLCPRISLTSGCILQKLLLSGVPKWDPVYWLGGRLGSMVTQLRHGVFMNLRLDSLFEKTWL